MLKQPERDALTLSELESLLDHGQVECLMGSGRWWRLRRNGQTKRWKTRPAAFRIPVKAGLRSCTYLTEDDLEHFGRDFRFAQGSN